MDQFTRRILGFAVQRALFHIIANITRLLGSGPRAMVADSILVKRQLLARSATNIKPSTVLNSTSARNSICFRRRAKKVRQVRDGGNAQGLLGQ
jgi:hypothetical protein